MLRVIYKNLVTMARRRDLSDFEREVSKEHRGFKGCVQQSPELTPIERLWEILERRLRLYFPSPKHQIMKLTVKNVVTSLQ